MDVYTLWDDGVRKDSEYDMTAGKRLQEQRPHPIDKIKDEEGAQEVDTRSGCSGGCDVLAGKRQPKQRAQGDDHPDQNSEEHREAQVPHQDEEAGSMVFHSSSNASEFKSDNKDARVTASAAAKVREDFPSEDAEILRLIEERRSTPKEEKQRLKDLSKCIKNAPEKKRMKKQQDIQRILEDFKGLRNIPGIKSAKKKVLITKIKNDKGECITSRKGIADVFGEFYKRLYEANEKDDSEHQVNDDDNYSNTDVHNNDIEETAGIPEITTEGLQNAINKIKKKANPRTAKEFEPKTLKHVMR